MSPRQNNRLSILSLALGVGLLAGAGSVGAQATGSTSTGASTTGASTTGATNAGGSGASMSSADKSFVQKAAVGGLAEVEMGKLAQQKAANDQVKQFGSHMVDDHSKANTELQQVASSKGITLPTDLDANPRTAGRFAVRSIPTLLLLRGGREVKRQAGATQAAQIVAWVEDAR